MQPLTEIIISFIAAIAFSYIINVPKKAQIYAGFNGALAWAIKLGSLACGFSPLFSVFIASIFSSILAIYLARKLKIPASNFNLPGVFPMVPGITAFESMKSFMKQDILKGISLLGKTFSVSISIALAIGLTEALYNSFKKNYEKKPGS